jgi:type II secretory pathway pseudopilin PulG
MPALLAMLAIMTLALMLALPSWRYVAQDDKEQELIFRGGQISAAIARFQRKNGNALPTSFEQLVKGKYLRQEYKDPMTKDGKWRIVRPGEVAPVRPGGPAVPGRPAATPTPTPAPTFGGNQGLTGPIGGVASLSTETSLRTVNGNSTYNLWIFAPNIPLVIGGQTAAGPRPPGANQLSAPSRQRAPDTEAPRVSR